MWITDRADDAVLVRFRAPEPDERGRRLGGFALVNGLHLAGALDAADARLRRGRWDVLDAAYPDPTAAGSDAYDQALHPRAEAWSRADADDVLGLLPPVLDLLDRYGVHWERSSSLDPGRVVYADAWQVVVTPYERAGASRRRRLHG